MADGTPDDGITGMRVDVEMTLALPIEAVWDLVSDPVASAVHSPECLRAAWLDGATWPPKPGDRFEGRNRYVDGSIGTVVCEVTEAGRPDIFAWLVHDATHGRERPAALWRYELARTGEDRTLVRHGFEHGPGMSLLRSIVLERPEILERAITFRSRALRENMTATLRGLAGMPAAGADAVAP